MASLFIPYELIEISGLLQIKFVVASAVATVLTRVKCLVTPAHVVSPSPYYVLRS